MSYTLAGKTQFFDRGYFQCKDNIHKNLDWLLGSPSCWTVDWDSGDRVSQSLKRAVKALSWEIFRQHEDIEKIHLRKINPGFSGTHLVVATAYNKKSIAHANQWLLKVAEHDEEIDKLVGEISGFSVMKLKVVKKYRPELYETTTKNPMVLLPNWWGAIAMSFEKGFLTLLERFNDIDAASLYGCLFQQVLAPLFGTHDTDSLCFDTLSEDTTRSASEWLQHNMSWSNAVSRHYNNVKADIEIVQKACDKGELKRLRERCDHGCGYGYQYVHGDLNCRNILVNEAGTEFLLIDFPHVTTNSGARPCAVDYAKAEVELLFIIMDYHSGLDIDLTRIPEWIPVLEALSQSVEGETSARQDDEIQRVYDCILQIRRSYCSMVSVSEDAWTQYRAILIDNCLRCLSYSDLTPAKRFASIIYASKIICSLH